MKSNMIYIIFLCNFILVRGGVADAFGNTDEYQRNIFPLPSIEQSRESGAQSGSEWETLANCGIRALNELAGCTNSSFQKKKMSRVQRRAMQHVSRAFQDVAQAHEGESGHSALQDLCSSSRLYQADRSDVVSYVKDRVSWPEVASSPVQLGSCLSAADRKRLATWRQHMLKDKQDLCGDPPIKHAYMDPILKNNPKEYATFLHELQQRDMISFQPLVDESGDLGIFFVRKKNDSQRLIFDTRILNHKFIDPPSTDLPSADAFTRLELPENSSFVAGSGDLANAFYTLAVPDDLGRMFTLPAIEAEKLGLTSIDGCAVRPGQRVTPYLTVLPMGWAWALHLCQSVLMQAIEDAGFGGSQVISDKGHPVQLHSHCDVACGGYVDNFIVIGCDRFLVDAGLRRIGDQLRGRGLTVHEEECATSKIDFVGLSFDGERGTISIKAKRIVKLQRAIHELVSRNFASGEVLQLLLGHITWALMARREGLSILKSCYAFVNENKSTPKRLWPSVRWELQTIADLLPLFRAHVNVGWSNDVSASDSSPYGYGICCRKLDTTDVGNIGADSERWRYRFEDAADARRHAAKNVGRDELDKDVKKLIREQQVRSSSHEFVAGFNEVPINVLDPDEWTVVWSRPWKYQDNILHTEALALCWSVEHALRANRNFGKRILLLSDNLPLTLGVCKGRAKSSFLTKPLRKICALSLATGSKFHVRWIPSEWNVADRPSRALTQWSARGLESWLQDRPEVPSRKFRDHSNVQFTEPREKVETSEGGVNSNDGSRRDDISGSQKCETTDAARLPEEIQGIPGLASTSSDLGFNSRSDGRSAGGDFAGDVRCRAGDQRWDSGSCCHKVPCASVMSVPAKINTSVERVAPCSPPNKECQSQSRC